VHRFGMRRGRTSTVRRLGIRNYRPVVLGLVLLVVAFVFALHGSLSAAIVWIVLAVAWGRHAWRPPVPYQRRFRR
jgi:hypothetical protein